jgi:hypothetical protein
MQRKQQAHSASCLSAPKLYGRRLPEVQALGTVTA